MNFGQCADGRQIVRRQPYYLLQFLLRVVVLLELDQCSSERDTRREVAGMLGEPGTSDANGLVEGADAAALFRQDGKGDRRRILLDPASQFV